MLRQSGSQQRKIIASGVEAYPNLAQMAYQAVRLLRGDIRPEQFMTGPGEDAGFFDALGNGPVSATDPRALGGDLVEASRSEEHTSELQSLMRSSYAVFCLKKKKHTSQQT